MKKVNKRLLVRKSKPKRKPKKQILTKKVNIPFIKTFISYSWDNEEHKNWVLKFSKVLRNKGIDIILDQFELDAGRDLTYFIDKNLKRSKKVIIVLTPNYAKKADGRRGGVGEEYSIIRNDESLNAEKQLKKYIPILRLGDKNRSCPLYLKSLVYIDMTDDSLFDIKIEETIKAIHKIKLVEKTPLGDHPDFVKQYYLKHAKRQ